ncbi:MAG: hypothetical protein NTZ48_05480, partial [Candidatus Omnitrophica bacterium]|nr:hypothetical protein [Candidatus Omnitrophota bacterium]
MQKEINKIFIQFAKRAEKIDHKTLVESFVDTGSLLTVLKTNNNQILYGRRGTGKTHVLVFLQEILKTEGDLPIYIDMRNIGSSGGIYEDPNIPLSERATRLVFDTVAAIHDELLSLVLDDRYGLNLGLIGPALEELSEASSEVIVKGPVSDEIINSQTSGQDLGVNSMLTVGLPPAISVGLSGQINTTASEVHHTRRDGLSVCRLHFGRLGVALQKFSKLINGKKIWILIDEWSVVPIDLQPYLADLLRRTVFPAESVVVKIGAIEKRSQFQIVADDSSYIGIELGADIAADINMDDFMVFDNDENKAVLFFKRLVYNHFNSIRKTGSIAGLPNSEDELVRVAFSRQDVFRELVKASEGIPRDAFSILSNAAQMNMDEAIV